MLRGAIVVLFVVLSASFYVNAQETENFFIEGDGQGTQESPQQIQNSSPTLKKQNANVMGSGNGTNLSNQVNAKTPSFDYYLSGWNAKKYRNGFGYSPLLNLIQFERWQTLQWGYFIGLRYSKNQDSAIENKSSSFNQSTLQLTDTTTFSGARNPTTVVLAGGIKNRLWQNEWMQINWGALFMYSLGTSVSYSTGTVSRTVANTNTPDDSTISETNFGKVTDVVDPTYTLGVKFGSEFYVRWFPNLSLSADVLILNNLPIKGTSETNTATRTYSVVAGVPQSPTAETYNSSRVYRDFGGSASTSQVGAQFFSAFSTNWSIKYIW